MECSPGQPARQTAFIRYQRKYLRIRKQRRDALSHPFTATSRHKPVVNNRNPHAPSSIPARSVSL